MKSFWNWLARMFKTKAVPALENPENQKKIADAIKQAADTLNKK